VEQFRQLNNLDINIGLSLKLSFIGKFLWWSDFYFTEVFCFLDNPEWANDECDLVKFADCRFESSSIPQKECADFPQIESFSSNGRKHHQD
jgi:hypothetical protein